MRWIPLVVLFLVGSSFGQDSASTVIQEPFPDYDPDRFFTEPEFFDVSSDGRILLLGTMGELRLYDLDSRCLMMPLRNPRPVMFAGAALDPTGQFLVFHRTVPPNYPIDPALLDITSEEEVGLRLDEPHQVGPWSLTVTEEQVIFTPTSAGENIIRPIIDHSNRIASGVAGKEGSTIFWHGGDSLEIRARDGSKSSINLIADPDLRFMPFPRVAFTENGHPILAAQDRNRIHVIDAMDDQPLAEFEGTRPVLDALGKRLALLEESGKVSVFDIASKNQLSSHGTPQQNPIFALSPDGKRLAVWQRELKAVLDIPLDGGQSQPFSWPWEGEYDDPAFLAYSPDGTFLSISSSGVNLEDLYLVNTDTRNVTSVEGVANPSFDRTGQYLAFTHFAGNGSGQLGVFDTKQNKVIYQSPLFDLSGYGPDSLTFSADSRSLLIPNGGIGILQIDFLDNPNSDPSVACRGDFKSRVIAQSDSRLWSTTSQGELVLIDAVSKNPLLRLLPFSNGHIVALQQNNRYLGRPETLDAVAFKKGKQAWPVEQFDLLLNRPHEILALLGAPEERVQVLQNAFERRLRREGLTDAEMQFALPTLEITNRSAIPLSTSHERVNLTYTAKGADAGLSEVALHINDVPVAESNSFDGSIDAVLAPGSNKIQLSVIDEAGAESLRQTLYVTHYPDQPSLPDLWVLAVGVSKYQKVPSLDVAAKDAEDLAALLAKGEGTSFNEVHTRLLIDEEATRENIHAAGSFLKQSRVEDQIIVFVAGHGLHDSNYDYWFATPDIDAENPAARGLSYDELEGLFAHAPARKRLLLMDTCFAGEVDREDLAMATQEKALPEGVRARVVRREAISTEQLKASDTNKALGTMFADFRRRTGATVLTASSGVEFVFALETEALGNGVFTHSFMEGIKTGKADLDGDGIIRVSEWQRFGFDLVVSFTEGQQRPTGRQLNREVDFEIARTGKGSAAKPEISADLPTKWLVTEQTNAANGNWRIEWDCTFQKIDTGISGSGNKVRVNGNDASSGESKTVFQFNTTLKGRAASGSSEEINASGDNIPGRVTITFDSNFRSLQGTLFDTKGNHISDLTGHAQ